MKEENEVIQETREQLIIHAIKEMGVFRTNFPNNEVSALVAKAIKALEQETCEDAISRQAVDTLIDELARAISDERCCISRGRSTATIMRDICHLSSVNPQPKTGKWIPVSERLPENKTYVLTTIKVPNRIAHARSGWYEGGFFHNDNGDVWKATDMEVVAWMPLPEPYKAESEE